jgi:hypothetical protein
MSWDHRIELSHPDVRASAAATKFHNSGSNSCQSGATPPTVVPAKRPKGFRPFTVCPHSISKTRPNLGRQ